MSTIPVRFKCIPTVRSYCEELIEKYSCIWNEQGFTGSAALSNIEKEELSALLYQEIDNADQYDALPDDTNFLIGKAIWLANKDCIDAAFNAIKKSIAAYFERTGIINSHLKKYYDIYFFENHLTLQGSKNNEHDIKRNHQYSSVAQ